MTDLAKLVAAFERLDAQLNKTSLDRLAADVEQAIAAKNRVKDYLAASPGGRVAAGPLAERVRRIRENRGYNVDRVVSVIESVADGRVAQELEDDDWMDALHREGTRRYVDDTYFMRRRQVAAFSPAPRLLTRFERICFESRSATRSGCMPPQACLAERWSKPLFLSLFDARA